MSDRTNVPTAAPGVSDHLQRRRGSPILEASVARLMLVWPETAKDDLQPLRARITETADDGKDAVRVVVAGTWASRTMLAPWLKFLGLDHDAEILTTATDAAADQQQVLRAQAVGVGRAVMLKDAALRDLLDNTFPGLAAECTGDSVAALKAVAAAVASAVAYTFPPAVAQALSRTSLTGDSVAKVDVEAVRQAIASVAGAPPAVSHDHASYIYFRENPLPFAPTAGDPPGGHAAFALLEALIDPVR